MIVEYKKLKYGYTPEGWEQAYVHEYQDLAKLRLKLLIEDEAICPVLRVVYKIMLELRQKNRPIEVLDIGCGVGHQLCSIAHLCDYAVGFDISDEVVKNNNMLNCSAKFVQGDALHHPSLGRQFNLILMAGVLYAVSADRETHKRILSEAFKSLSDDGYFVFYHRAYLNLLTYLDKTLVKWKKRIQGAGQEDYYMCWFDDKYILRLLDEIGFCVVAIDKADFAYPMSSTIFRRFLVQKRFRKYDEYKSYDHYLKEYDSYKRLNVAGI